MREHFPNINKINQLPEIKILKLLGDHPNIIQLKEALYDEPTGRLAMVFELMD